MHLGCPKGTKIKAFFILVSVTRQDSPCYSYQVLFPHTDQASGFRILTWARRGVSSRDPQAASGASNYVMRSAAIFVNYLYTIRVYNNLWVYVCHLL